MKIKIYKSVFNRIATHCCIGVNDFNLIQPLAVLSETSKKEERERDEEREETVYPLGCMHLVHCILSTESDIQFIALCPDFPKATCLP